MQKRSQGRSVGPWLILAVILITMAVSVTWFIHEKPAEKARGSSGVEPVPQTAGRPATARIEHIAEPGKVEIVERRGADVTAERLPRAEVRIGGHTMAEHGRFRQGYYCDLAMQAREACERGGRTGQAFDMCLALRQYPTYSRHCRTQN